MNNKGEDTGWRYNKGEDTNFSYKQGKTYFFTENITFFSNKRIDFFQNFCPANTSHNCHFKTQYVFGYTIHKLQLYAFEKVVVGTMSNEILLCRSNL